MPIREDLLHVQVPKPFTLLGYSEEIMPGDIKQLPGSTIWENISGVEVGMRTPKTGVVYARLVLPDMTRIAYAGERIHAADLAWVDGVTLGWVQASRLLRRNGESGAMTVEEFYAFFREKLADFGRMFVVKPGIEVPDYRVIPRPSGCRDLWPSDVLRPYDMVIGRGDRVWRHVTERVFGTQLRDLGPEWTHTKFCRPTSPMAKDWYVCEDEGQRGFLGGYQDPFPSLDEACRAIENACRVTGKVVIGVVWRKSDGIPLMVYDPKLTPSSNVVDGAFQRAPETGVRALPEPRQTQTAPKKRPKPTPKSAQNHFSDEFEWATNEGRPNKPIELSTCPVGDLMEKLAAEAAERLPKGVRLMRAHEELQKNDIVYREAPYAMPDGIPAPFSWQPAPADMLGLEIHAVGLPCGRLTTTDRQNDRNDLLDRLQPVREDNNDRTKTKGN